MNALRSHIDEVPDHPQPGILFRDISPLLRDHLPETLDALAAQLTPDEWRQVDLLGVIDARGFVLGAALAAHQRKGLVMIRKAGKLPPPVVQTAYALEYGEATLEMKPGHGRLLLVDDVYATGGTLRAAADLATRAGYTVAGALVLADLGLRPRPVIGQWPLRAVLQYP